MHPDELQNSLSASSLTGKRLGPYMIQAEIASGGMGTVYMAYHQGLGRQVALKTLLANQPTEEEMRRFNAEARLVAQIDHPNVVPVYDAGEVSGVRYLAMEFVPGKTLQRMLREMGALTDRDAVELVRDVGRGLDAAHALGIIHRDLKPSNILVQANGVPRLTDFGVARQAGGDRMTATGIVMGTPAYMAPEQARGRRDVDARSDVYGLGAILYECLTGFPPHVRGSQLATLQAVVSDPIPSPLERAPDLPRDVVAVCMKALEKEPEDRYRSAADMVDDLTRVLDGGTVRARPIGTRTRALRSVRKNGMLIATTTVITLAFVTLGLAALLPFLDEEREADLVERAAAWRTQRLAELRREAETASPERLEALRLLLTSDGLEREGLAALAPDGEGATVESVRAGLRAAGDDRLGPLLAMIRVRLAADGERYEHLAAAGVLDPDGEAGRAARLEVARAVYATGAARRLALDELIDLSAGDDVSAQVARALHAQAAADSMDPRGTSALARTVDSARLPAADAERLGALQALTSALRPRFFLPESKALDAGQVDGQAALLRLDGARVLGYVLQGVVEGSDLEPLRKWTLEGWRPQGMVGVAWGGEPAVLLVQRQGGGLRLGTFPTSAPSGNVKVREVARIEGSSQRIALGKGDVNGDGHTDLAIVAYDLGSDSHLLLGGPRPSTLRIFDEPRAQMQWAFESVALADLDEDGRDEIVVAASALRHGVVRALALAKDGGGFVSRGSVHVGLVRRLHRRPDGKGVVAVVDRDGEQDLLPRRSLPPWVGRDGVYLLGSLHGQLAITHRWTFGEDGPLSRKDALRVRKVAGFVLPTSEGPWLVRSFWEHGDRPWRMEAAPLSRFSNLDDNPAPACSIRAPNPGSDLGDLSLRLLGDLDGDGDHDLIWGGALHGAGTVREEERSPVSEPTEKTEPQRLLTAVRMLRALQAGERPGGELLDRLRADYPDSSATQAAILGEVDGLLSEAAASRAEGERAFKREDPERGRMLLLRAHETSVTAAELAEDLARSDAAWRPDPGAAWARAGHAWAEVGELKRAEGALREALGAGALPVDAKARIQTQLRGISRRASRQRLDVSFAQDAVKDLGILRPLRASFVDGGLKIPAAGEVEDSCFVRVSLTPGPVKVSAKLRLHGSAWSSRVQVGLFEPGGGADARLTGCELQLWDNSTRRLQVRPLVGGRPIARSRVVSPSFAVDLDFSLELLPAEGGGTAWDLRVQLGEGPLVFADRGLSDTSLLPDRGSAETLYLGVVAPQARNVEELSVEQTLWPMESAVTLRSMRVEAPGLKREKLGGVYPANELLVRGEHERALAEYERLSRSSDRATRINARWLRGFARTRSGDAKGYTDLVTVAREDPYFALLRLEDTARLESSERDLTCAALAALELSHQDDPALKALGRQLRGGLDAAVNPDKVEGAHAKRTLAYLSMRRVKKPHKVRWEWKDRYKTMVPGGRLPRSLFPPVLETPQAKPDDAEFRHLARPQTRDPLAAYVSVARARCLRPEHPAPRVMLAQMYSTQRRLGIAIRLIQEFVLPLDLDSREKVVALSILAQAQAGLAQREDLLETVRQLKELGANSERLRIFQPLLGDDPRFEELLRGE